MAATPEYEVLFATLGRKLLVYKQFSMTISGRTGKIISISIIIKS